MSEYDEVHRSHCCAGIHGCKYMDDDCPVQMKRIPPQYKCQDCEEERQDLAQRLAAMPAELALQICSDIKKFKLNPKYPHKRSEGLTNRRNSGTKFQVKGKK